MFGDRECGAVANPERYGKSSHLFKYGAAANLSVMGILVAVGAGCEFHLIDGVLARG